MRNAEMGNAEMGNAEMGNAEVRNFHISRTKLIYPSSNLVRGPVVLYLSPPLCPNDNGNHSSPSLYVSLLICFDSRI